MPLSITARNFVLTDAIHKRVEDKVSPLLDGSVTPISIEVVLESHQGHSSECLCTINVSSPLPHIVSHATNSDMYAAIVEASHRAISAYRVAIDKRYKEHR